MAEVTVGFAKFNPGTGNGDQIVQVSADAYEGRVLRTATAQVQTNDGSVTKQVVVNQKAIAEFVTIDETASIAKTGGSVTINGRSNSTTLTFTLGEGQTLTLTLPDTYNAAGKATASGAAIEGDPGASGGYDFTITFTDIAANTTVGDLTNTLTVQAAGGQTDSCAITQAAGDPTLEVDVETIELEATGDAKQLQITSNTDWTISQVVAQAFKAAARKLAGK